MATLPKVIWQKSLPARRAPVDSRASRREDAAELELIADWMDSAFRIPGLGWRFGLDALIGLIPGIGDAATSLVSLYLIARARRMGVPRSALARMAANMGIDLAVGAVPVLGDVFDAYFKANQRNVRLLLRHAQASPSEERKLRRADRTFVAGVIAALAMLLVGAVVSAYYLIAGLMGVVQNLMS